MTKISDLLVDTNVFNEEKLASVLQPFVRLGKDGSVHFLPSTFNMGVKEKIILYLLAREAIAYLPGGIKPKQEKVTPSVLSKDLRIKGGTLRPILKSLKDRGIVLPSSDGGYVVHILALGEAEKILKREAK